MQWKTISTSLGETVYSLWNNGRKLLTLDYKRANDRVYVQSEDGEKRYFTYRKKGVLKNKVVLENEYGTNLGKLEKEAGREYILLEDKKYYLNFLNQQEVVITTEDSQKPLAVCSLDPQDTGPTKKGLVMVLCYYLLGHPQKSEEPVFSI